MRKKEDKKSPGQLLVTSLVIGTVSGFLLTLVLFMVFASLIVSGRVPEDLMGAITVIAALIGAAFGAVLAARRNKTKVLPVGLGVGALMFLFSLAGAAFSADNSITGGLTPFLFLALIAGGAGGGLLTAKRKKRKHT